MAFSVKHPLTMHTRQWIETIFAAHYKAMCDKHGREVGKQKIILLIDVWKIHVAKSNPDDFLPWIQAKHPEIIVIFVPGGCECSPALATVDH